MTDTRPATSRNGIVRTRILCFHPLGGFTKEDDVPLHWRMKQHEKVLEDGVLIQRQPGLYSHLLCTRLVQLRCNGLERLNILPFRVAAYDKIKNGMAFFDPSRSQDFIFISGTKMRKLAKNKEPSGTGLCARVGMFWWNTMIVWIKLKMARVPEPVPV
ncbi:alpha tubulin suppressor [Datura stramonium]|uniref:Alpha tubulin suppressor n=1 Tax=Datura stramonium TaxID=4076 RepID=A0ABS8VNV5_DATST|nr:alpha tubulin suppressor [Datura stramonium]